MTEDTNDDKETKLVFSPNIARTLLRMGNTIVDIKPNKENKMRTVFVFRNDGHFRDSFSEAVSASRKDE